MGPTGGKTPKPGEGPEKEERDAGFYDVRSSRQRRRPASARAVRGDRDPGYGSTAKMIAEAGVCLVQERSDVRAASGPRARRWGRS